MWGKGTRMGGYGGLDPLFITRYCRGSGRIVTRPNRASWTPAPLTESWCSWSHERGSAAFLCAPHDTTGFRSHLWVNFVTKESQVCIRGDFSPPGYKCWYKIGSPPPADGNRGSRLVLIGCTTLIRISIPFYYGFIAWCTNINLLLISLKVVL